MLNDLSNTSPNLAGTEDIDLIKVVSRKGKGEKIVEWVKPERWDGKSPLGNGIVYVFYSLEEERSAMAATSPQLLKQFEAMLQERAPHQEKIKSSPVLAVDDYNAYADAWVSGGKMNGKGECHTLEGWSGYSLQHQIRIDTNSHGTFWEQKAYYDDDEYYDELEKAFDCAESFTVDAWVRTDGGTQDHASDSDSCN